MLWGSSDDAHGKCDAALSDVTWQWAGASALPVKLVKSIAIGACCLWSCALLGFMVWSTQSWCWTPTLLLSQRLGYLQLCFSTIWLFSQVQLNLWISWLSPVCTSRFCGIGDSPVSHHETIIEKRNNQFFYLPTRVLTVIYSVLPRSVSNCTKLLAWT